MGKGNYKSCDARRRIALRRLQITRDLHFEISALSVD